MVVVEGVAVGVAVEEVEVGVAIPPLCDSPLSSKLSGIGMSFTTI
jgi:hypothetical protein